MINENRKKLMKEFMGARMIKALEDHSDKTTRYAGRGCQAVNFYNLTDLEWEGLVEDVMESMNEYLSGDFWE
tara:strand:+ start:418 stop:633 length:216 start_codon:yes stop_codon:yes gene_type:complete